jgi:16S rRNA (guanine966-N2)-methyltransferase
MRVVSGTYGGRILVDPKGHRTHPMSEKARGALFNSLGDLRGRVILDAFSGSGAVAIEAISRGAKHVVAIDYDFAAVKNINQNIELLGIEVGKIEVIKSRLSSWSLKHYGVKFDIVICDPPYDKFGSDIFGPAMRHIKDKCIFVLSHPKSASGIKLQGFETVKELAQGDAVLTFYKKLSSS